MPLLQEYRCDVCGTGSYHPNRWFVIQCSESELTVLRWNQEVANAPGAHHFCGEGDAQIYISRWFESLCSAPKNTFQSFGEQSK